MGVMDILPDQTPIEKNQTDGGEQKNGRDASNMHCFSRQTIIQPEKEILRLIRQGF